MCADRNVKPVKGCSNPFKRKAAFVSRWRIRTAWYPKEFNDGSHSVRNVDIVPAASGQKMRDIFVAELALAETELACPGW